MKNWGFYIIIYFIIPARPQADVSHIFCKALHTALRLELRRNESGGAVRPSAERISTVCIVYAYKGELAVLDGTCSVMCFGNPLPEAHFSLLFSAQAAAAAHQVLVNNL